MSTSSPAACGPGAGASSSSEPLSAGLHRPAEVAQRTSGSGSATQGSRVAPANTQSAGLYAQSRAPTAQAVTLADLQSVGAHEATNTLYGAPGVRASNLVWYWHLGTPTQIEEWVTLAADDIRIEIALDGDAPGLATHALDWRAYTGDTRLLAWTACHEPLIDLLRAVFRRDWLPESIGDCDAQTREACVHAGFIVCRPDGALVVSGIANFDATWISTLEAHPGATEPRQHPMLSAVRARLPIVLDEVDMPATELDSITPGAIVRLDNRTLPTRTARVAIAAGHAHLIADINGLQATVIGFAARQGDPMSHTPFTPGEAMAPGPNAARPTAGRAPTAPGVAAPRSNGVAPDAGPATPGTDAAMASSTGVHIATLPVRLSFLAGRLTLPFGELANIGPGYVFALDKRLDDQAITICANDVPVAVGELVTIGDLVGVRITRMVPRA